MPTLCCPNVGKIGDLLGVRNYSMELPFQNSRCSVLKFDSTILPIERKDALWASGLSRADTNPDVRRHQFNLTIIHAIQSLGNARPSRLVSN
jgi:hypothetical protein